MPTVAFATVALVISERDNGVNLNHTFVSSVMECGPTLTTTNGVNGAWETSWQLGLSRNIDYVPSESRSQLDTISGEVDGMSTEVLNAIRGKVSQISTLAKAHNIAFRRMVTLKEPRDSMVSFFVLTSDEMALLASMQAVFVSVVYLDEEARRLAKERDERAATILSGLRDARGS